MALPTYDADATALRGTNTAHNHKRVGNCLHGGGERGGGRPIWKNDSDMFVMQGQKTNERVFSL